ncbi:hepcidin [Tupaia chinensis]|uniref:Hepcidin n=1 Tax=Tupaia chinensis TaxID=246437 RepID=L8XZ67_TUPCH|nr:hepcidin [Tupaia chinensis]ELV09358.1 Hepcidin [Tupaia chinensis]
MTLSTQIRAACLLLLLLSSLTAGSTFQQPTGQLADRQPQDSARSTASLTPLFQNRGKRDTHFPVCHFCCNCCSKPGCGICCLL